MRRKTKKLIVLAPLAIVGLALFVALGGVIVMLLWNGLLPALFAWPRITFWQGLGILVLCRILFGGFGVRGSHRSRFRDRTDEHWPPITEEERERFRQGMRRRFGLDPTGGSDDAP